MPIKVDNQDYEWDIELYYDIRDIQLYYDVWDIELYYEKHG